MGRQRGRIFPGKIRQLSIDNPNEKVQLAEFIDGIKQYQDEEYKWMRAEFERVERLIALDNKAKRKENNLLPTEKLQLQDRKSESQPQFVSQYGNTHTIRTPCRYVKWTLLFFVLLCLGVMFKLYLGRSVDNISGILEFVKKKLSF